MCSGVGFCKQLKESLSRSSSFKKIAPSSSGNLEMSSTKVVREQLECPICTNLMYPPIYQCPSGHTLCSSCKAKVHKRCPTCRQELGNIRCLAMEKITESLDLPCRYQNFGCNEILSSYSRLKHEKNCKHRPFSCPFPGDECCVTGDISFLVKHLKDHHKVSMQDGSTFKKNYVKTIPQKLPIPRAKGRMNVFNCFGRQFCLLFEASKLEMTPVCMAYVQFMGEDDEAKQFAYSLEVPANDRKLVWEGVPRSIRDSRKNILDSQDGLIIHSNSKIFFSDDILKLAGRIWKKS